LADGERSAGNDGRRAGAEGLFEAIFTTDPHSLKNSAQRISAVLRRQLPERPDHVATAAQTVGDVEFEVVELTVLFERALGRPTPVAGA
jgi:hypothetical protein